MILDGWGPTQWPTRSLDWTGLNCFIESFEATGAQDYTIFKFSSVYVTINIEIMHYVKLQF